MIDFDEFQELKSRRNSVKESYEYAIRDLNNAMKDYNNKQKFDKEGFHHDPTPESYLTANSTATYSFLRLVEFTKKYYDIKAEYEELNREYMRQSRIFDLEDEIEKYIDRIKYNNSLDNIILLKEVLNELYKIIK